MLGTLLSASKDLWEKYKTDMVTDYTRNNDMDTAINLALLDIENVLQQRHLHCSSFGLPQPVENHVEPVVVDFEMEQIEADRLISTLNHQQLEAFQKVKHIIEHDDASDRCFFLDGPGGSGKTYLYKTIMCFYLRNIIFLFLNTLYLMTNFKRHNTLYFMTKVLNHWLQLWMTFQTAIAEAE